MIRPKVLTIAGSDPSGGAGIQADLKTFTAHGVYGMSVVTALTVQTPAKVDAVHSIPVDFVRQQLTVLLDRVGVDAIKIGMLGTVDVVEVVAEVLEAHSGIPTVIDPVMVASAGGILLEDGAKNVLLERLLPLARVITPNLPEIEALTAQQVGQFEEAKSASRELFRLTRSPVLLKGGHGDGGQLVDLLFEGGRFHQWSHRRLGGPDSSFHGTGCSLSAAIAARLALGRNLEEAVDKSIAFLQRALQHAFSLDEGPDVPDLLNEIRPVL